MDLAYLATVRCGKNDSVPTILDFRCVLDVWDFGVLKGVAVRSPLGRRAGLWHGCVSDPRSVPASCSRGACRVACGPPLPRELLEPAWKLRPEGLRCPDGLEVRPDGHGFEKRA